jgi:hypothetical protein
MSVTKLFKFAVAAVATIFAFPASAVWLSENGATATLTGSIETGDDAIFRAFLDRPRAQPIRVIYLSSHGGKLTPAIEIARVIRKAGITTAVQADSSVCSSACTVIFAGGIRRHNINGNSVFEGMTSLTGLGFHPSHRAGGSRVSLSTLSEGGTERMRKFYAEMGMPRATELMEKAAINTLYRPGGQTSLTLRIATSLAAP